MGEGKLFPVSPSRFTLCQFFLPIGSDSSLWLPGAFAGVPETIWLRLNSSSPDVTGRADRTEVRITYFIVDISYGLGY